MGKDTIVEHSHNNQIYPAAWSNNSGYISLNLMKVSFLSVRRAMVWFSAPKDPTDGAGMVWGRQYSSGKIWIRKESKHNNTNVNKHSQRLFFKNLEK